MPPDLRKRGEGMTTHREALEHLRDTLTAELASDMCRPNDAAALSRELRAVWAELEALPAADSKAPADEIARRRERRRKRAAGE